MVKNKIIYIAGFSRSGSTLLTGALNRLEDAIAVGEARYFWDRGINENWKCNCGQKFIDCSFWTKVVLQMYNKQENLNLITNKILSINENSFEHGKKRLRLRHLILQKKIDIQKRIKEEYILHLEALYDSISIVSGKSNIIDSSKSLEYLIALDKIKCTELYILHLIRDVRGVVYSENFKMKKLAGSKNEEKLFVRKNKFIGVIQTLFFWLLTNYLIKKIYSDHKNYIFLHYEDFIDNPDCFLYKVQNHIKIIEENEISVKDVSYCDFHSFSGNPNRIKNREEIHKVDEWRTNLNIFLKFILAPFNYFFKL